MATVYAYSWCAFVGFCFGYIFAKLSPKWVHYRAPWKAPRKPYSEPQLTQIRCAMIDVEPWNKDGDPFEVPCTQDAVGRCPGELICSKHANSMEAEGFTVDYFFVTGVD